MFSVYHYRALAKEVPTSSMVLDGIHSTYVDCLTRNNPEAHNHRPHCALSLLTARVA
jgi:hypothetical protein